VTYYPNSAEEKRKRNIEEVGGVVKPIKKKQYTKCSCEKSCSNN
jgi:hypothetical protein